MVAAIETRTPGTVTTVSVLDVGIVGLSSVAGKAANVALVVLIEVEVLVPVIAPPPYYTMPVTSQSPAVREMLVMLVCVLVVSATALPLTTVLDTYSPT